jgi:subtilisin-like proprotein convertase family protein
LGSSTVAGDFGSSAGVLLVAPGLDPGGGPVTYEVFGGAYPDFTPVGDAPLVELPGLNAEGRTSFAIRAADPAGNRSVPVFVDVVDASLRAHSVACVNKTTPSDCMTTARERKVFLLQNANASAPYGRQAQVCASDARGATACTLLASVTGTNQTLSLPDAYGRYAVYDQTASDNSRSYVINDFGPDLLPDTPDDQPPFPQGAGDCPAIGPSGIVYFNAATTGLRMLTFGFTHDVATGSDVDVVGEAAVLDEDCHTYHSLVFNGREILWQDLGGPSRNWGTYLLDLGPDGVPSGDDGVEQRIADDADLFGRRIYRYDDNTAITPGPDDIFGTADDVLDASFPPVLANSGDKVVVAPQGIYSPADPVLLRDVSTHETVSFDHKEPFFEWRLDHAELAPGRFAAAVTYGVASQQTKMGWLEAASSLSFSFGDMTALGAFLEPSGAFDGPLGVILLPPRALAVELVHGASYSAASNWMVTGSANEVDVSGHLFVYQAAAGNVLIYDAGADGRPGTADDRGPTELVPASDHPRWPRIDGHVVVWADVVTTPPFSDWLGSPYESRIRAVDLGADGWPGGGDDTPYDVTTHGTEIFPDVSQGYVVWLDGRAAGLDVYGKHLALAGEDAIAVGPQPHASVQIDGNTVIWLQRDPSVFPIGGAPLQWDLWAYRLGDSPRRIARTPWNESQPCVDGDRLGWTIDVAGEQELRPAVVAAGTDGLFGTSDDVTLLPPRAYGRSNPDPLNAPRWHWLTHDYAFFGTRAIPVGDRALLVSATPEASIPDGDPVGLSVPLAVTAPAHRRVGDFAVRLAITHADPTQLVITLTSPSGDPVRLFDGALPNGPPLDHDLDLGRVPALFSHTHEPVAGTWTLRVVDAKAGASGVLHSVELRQRN